MALATGTRVEISYPLAERTNDLADAFHGKTGRIVSVEKDGYTKMFRVVLDEPVEIHGVLDYDVTSDLWAGSYLIDLDAKDRRREQARERRAGTKAAYESAGMRQVRGGQGGVYWE